MMIIESTFHSFCMQPATSTGGGGVISQSNHQTHYLFGVLVLRSIWPADLLAVPQIAWSSKHVRAYLPIAGPPASQPTVWGDASIQLHDDDHVSSTTLHIHTLTSASLRNHPTIPKSTRRIRHYCMMMMADGLLLLDRIHSQRERDFTVLPPHVYNLCSQLDANSHIDHVHEGV